VRGAGGEVVWDNARQQGYLSLEGLAGVDPRRGAYQLWIFDATRDSRYPIDGGLFTMAEGQAPTVVPIRAAVPVREPTLFAITLEPPGGVVVSDRKRIMLTASWPGSGEAAR
jgi:anti-sigma-K factor RskA